MKNPINNHKQFCKEIAPVNWTYVGFDEGFYIFQSGSYSTGFLEMKCIEEDLTIENLQLMSKLKISRV